MQGNTNGAFGATQMYENGVPNALGGAHAMKPKKMALGDSPTMDMRTVSDIAEQAKTDGNPGTHAHDANLETSHSDGAWTGRTYPGC